MTNAERFDWIDSLARVVRMTGGDGLINEW